MKRRHFIASAVLPMAACTIGESSTAHITGSFTGIDMARGHQLRDTTQRLEPTVLRTTQVLIAGGGVAGLAAARALRLRAQEDFALLELEDSAGGNSRAGVLDGMACPQGAHYLPLPGDDAFEVQNLLEEFGLRQRLAGRWVYDDRHLCHSPQERLYFHGAWQDGLLPVRGVGAQTLAQYRQFAALVEGARKAVAWTIPASKSPWTPMKSALAATTFVAYLDAHGLTDPHLRWYLNYCCQDDFGAGIATVSAWAGLHYFASRHGFHAPGQESAEREGLLTWPEGNAWLARRMAAPLGDRLRTGCVVTRIEENRHGVEVDAYNTATHQMERWQAARCIVALPVFVAARVVRQPPPWLTQTAQRTVYAPWLVANIGLREPLHDRPGPAPSWDNVLYSPAREGAPSTEPGGLGYVDAMHQSLRPVPGPTVLTHYRALGDVPGGVQGGRALLQSRPWAAWRDLVVAELSVAHPDLAAKATHLDITRYGHAMAVPVPQKDGQIGLQRPSELRGKLSKKEHWIPHTNRLSFAHSDWAGYSVFEEAFSLGHAAGSSV